MPVSTSVEPGAAIATDRRPGAGTRIRVGIVGATGYVGAELIRLLSRHPDVEIGSYPFHRRGVFGSSLVIRGTDPARLEAVAEEVRALVRRLGGNPTDEPA